MFNMDFDIRSAVKAHQPITEAEEEFLADLTEDDDYIVDTFLDNAREHGAVWCSASLSKGDGEELYYEFSITENPDYEEAFMDRFPDYQGATFADEDNEPLFYVPLLRFCGLYMIDLHQYGEGSEQFGPYGSLKDAQESFESVLAMHLP